VVGNLDGYSKNTIVTHFVHNSLFFGMSSTTEQIKERLGVVDVVSSYIKLERAGKNLKAKCPFHNEKTPSFFVSPERESFYCFGCNRGGDIFTFVEEFEGTDFSGALALLAERAGVSIKRFDSGEGKTRERLLLLMEKAAGYFESELALNSGVLAYLLKRGVSNKTIAEFQIGYAPASWRATSQFLLQKGFREQELLEAGLLVRTEKGVYDRFRGRIMFPIQDIAGRVIAFSGRIFSTGDPLRHSSSEASGTASGRDEEKERAAKYINSPETELFKKSKVLYGFDKAKQALRKHDRCVVVEGQTDVILSHQCGMKNTVAASGTALSQEHLNLIARFTNNLVLAFDADSAGLSAAGRGIDSALALGFNVLLMPLPQGKDPADLIKDDKEAWQRAVGRAVHLVDFYLTKFKDTAEDARSFQRQVERYVLPYIARIKSKIEQAHFVARVAKALGIPEEPIWEEMLRIEQAPSATLAIPTETPSHVGGRYRKNLERQMLAIIISERRLKTSPIDFKAAEALLVSLSGKTIAEKTSEFTKEEINKMLFEAESYYADSKNNIGEIFDEILVNLKTEILKERLTRAMNELRRSEGIKDEKGGALYLQECHDISREINKLNQMK